MNRHPSDAWEDLHIGLLTTKLEKLNRSRSCLSDLSAEDTG
jgi:hypothetical protein